MHGSWRSSYTLNPVWIHAWQSGQSIDLVMEDFDECIDDNAYYYPETDYIWFNVYQMNQDTPDQKQDCHS